MKREGKSRVLDHTREGKAADYALAAAIILAPVLGGGSSLLVLPVLTLATVIAAGATYLAARKVGSSIHLTWLSIAFAAFALFTFLQAVPLPADLVAFLSPKTADLRGFDAPLSAYPLTYEASATLREAAKLMLYALIALVAYERARARSSIDVVTVPLVIAGLSAALLALIHRALGLEQMFGMLPTRRPISEMLTTFANPNHTAGFMALASLSAIGLALSHHANTRSRQVGYAVVAVVCGMLSLLALSRGGMVALAGGLMIFTGLLALRRRSLKGALAPLVAAVLIAPLVLLPSKLENLVWTVSRTGEADLGPAGKLAAVKDALPMIGDHLYFGIGRGSYISLYSYYKQSPAQLVFAYPENIAVQLVADWGVIVGPLALALLLFCVLRRLFKADTEALGALSGVAAVLAQNIVDFSLELPGVALPVAAILGATGVGFAKKVRLPSREDKRTIAVLGLSSVFAAAAVCLAFVTGDLDRDVASIKEAIATGQDASLAEVEESAKRHPVNPYAAALASYAEETSSPPDLKSAVRWANRALYFAPTYADGHLAIGRLLITSGHRNQGFIALRQAWSLASNDRRPAFVKQILRLARTPEEVLLAVPRRDPELDHLDERSLSLASKTARELRKKEWAKTLVAAAPLESAVEDGLRILAPEAIAAGDTELAERAALKLRALQPDDPLPALLLAKLYLARGATEDAQREAERVASGGGEDAAVALRMLIDIALAGKDHARARKTFAQLIDATPQTRRGQVELAKYEALIETNAGNPAVALKALSRAIDLAPENVPLHMQRARVLMDTGHLKPAADELSYVLARQPQHKGAQRLLARIDALRKGSQTPENEAKSDALSADKLD